MLLADGRRRLSLVDATSLVTLREEKIDEVLAFDPHLRP